MGYAKQMGHGHDPAAIISVGIVEDVELPGGPAAEVPSTEAALVFQGCGHGVGEPLPGTHEAARQRPLPSAISGPLMQEHGQAAIRTHGEQGDIHGHVRRWEGRYRLGRHGSQATAASTKVNPCFREYERTSVIVISEMRKLWMEDLWI